MQVVCQVFLICKLLGQMTRFRPSNDKSQMAKEINSARQNSRNDRLMIGDKEGMYNVGNQRQRPKTCDR